MKKEKRDESPSPPMNRDEEGVPNPCKEENEIKEKTTEKEHKGEEELTNGVKEENQSGRDRKEGEEVIF